MEPTRRQKEIIFRLSNGEGTKQIAHALGLSRFTVQRHITLAYERTETVNAASLVAMALREGWIQ